MAGRCTEGPYKGEICLKPPANYPVTEGGKLSPGRIRNAPARAAQNGDMATIKKNGLCTYMAKIGATSGVCGQAAKSASMYGVNIS